MQMHPNPRGSVPFQSVHPEDLTVSETVHQMVVDDADRLKMGIDHGRSNEAEPSLLQVPAHDVGELRVRRYLSQLPPRVDDRTPIHESPEVSVERVELVPYLE